MITIQKIKLTASDPCIAYSRKLASGLDEKCTLEPRPVPAELTEAMQAILGDCIKIIGLDSDRWNDAGVSGITLKTEDDGLGFVATLINREDDDEGTIAIVSNTPFLKASRVEYYRGLDKKLIKICDTAIKFIESQPVQLDLIKGAA